MNYEDRDKYGMYKSEYSIGAGKGKGADSNRGPGPELMGAETLVGNDVCNRQDEDLGEIKEIMLDMNNGKVSYAVMTFGSFLGMGGKLFAVPWDALTLDTENKRFVLDVEKERLKDAPGFDQDDWPDMADPSWANTIHSYYGATSARQESLRR